MDWIRRVFLYTPLEKELLATKDENSSHKKYGSVINIDGVEVYVVVTPTPNESKIPELPAVILIHGLGGCTLSFSYLSQMLNRFAKVILVDLPGHGNSPDPVSNSAFKPEHTVELLTKLIERVCGDLPFVLIGHSYGTSHAFRISTGRLRDRCKGVVAITPPYNMNISTLSKYGAGFIPQVVFDATIRANDRKGGLYSPSVNRHFTANAGEQARREQLRINLLSRTRSVLQSVYYGNFYNTAAEKYPSCPVLIIGATADEICAIKHSRELCSDLKAKKCNVLLIEVRAAGHGILFEKPEVVDGVISRFIKDSIDERLSMAWQLHHIANQDNKWSLKNEEKWKSTLSVGEDVGGLKGMKVPKEGDDEHGPQSLEKSHPEIGAVIDISRETPPYNPESFKRIKYYKIPTVSKIPPSKSEVKEWIHTVNKVKAEIPAGSSIGVHCHYGFNRTGFFICSYLIEELDYTVEDALEAYRKSRNPGIRHQHFIDELHLRYTL